VIWILILDLAVYQSYPPHYLMVSLPLARNACPDRKMEGPLFLWLEYLAKTDFLAQLPKRSYKPITCKAHWSRLAAPKW